MNSCFNNFVNSYWLLLGEACMSVLRFQNYSILNKYLIDGLFPRDVCRCAVRLVPSHFIEYKSDKAGDTFCLSKVD